MSQITIMKVNTFAKFRFRNFPFKNAILDRVLIRFQVAYETGYSTLFNFCTIYPGRNRATSPSATDGTSTSTSPRAISSASSSAPSSATS